MKHLLIEEFNNVVGNYRAGKTKLALLKLLKEFAESPDEVWELEDKDILKPDGYLADKYGEKKTSTTKASFVGAECRKLVEQLQLSEFVHIQASNGRLFFVKKDML